MVVMLFGIVISVKLSQPLKAFSPIELTLSEIIILFNLLHLLKVPLQIKVTSSGIIMLSNCQQQLKAPLSIYVTGSPSISFGMIITSDEPTYLSMRMPEFNVLRFF